MSKSKEYGEQLYDAACSTNGWSRRSIVREQKTHKRHARCPNDAWWIGETGACIWAKRDRGKDAKG